MTHRDIYTKFMIEYDKANVTSSYPSLTPYEVATLLDKAYLALIARKITGNNPRRSQLESDIKSVSDLEPLIKTVDLSLSHVNRNISNYTLPNDFLYYVSSNMVYDAGTNTADGIQYRLLPVTITTHNVAERFFASLYNMPWVKNPVCYIEGGKAYLVYDPVDTPLTEGNNVASLTYIKSPAKFAGSSTFDPANPPTYEPDPIDDEEYEDPTNPTGGGQGQGLGQGQGGQLNPPAEDTFAISLSSLTKIEDNKYKCLATVTKNNVRIYNPTVTWLIDGSHPINYIEIHPDGTECTLIIKKQLPSGFVLKATSNGKTAQLDVSSQVTYVTPQEGNQGGQGGQDPQGGQGGGNQDPQEGQQNPGGEQTVTGNESILVYNFREPNSLNPAITYASSGDVIVNDKVFTNGPVQVSFVARAPDATNAIITKIGDNSGRIHCLHIGQSMNTIFRVSSGYYFKSIEFVGAAGDIRPLDIAGFSTVNNIWKTDSTNITEITFGNFFNPAYITQFRIHVVNTGSGQAVDQSLEKATLTVIGQDKYRVYFNLEYNDYLKQRCTLSLKFITARREVSIANADGTYGSWTAVGLSDGDAYNYKYIDDVGGKFLEYEYITNSKYANVEGSSNGFKRISPNRYRVRYVILRDSAWYGGYDTVLATTNAVIVPAEGETMYPQYVAPLLWFPNNTHINYLDDGTGAVIVEGEFASSNYIGVMGPYCKYEIEDGLEYVTTELITPSGQVDREILGDKEAYAIKIIPKKDIGTRTITVKIICSLDPLTSYTWYVDVTNDGSLNSATIDFTNPNTLMFLPSIRFNELSGKFETTFLDGTHTLYANNKTISVTFNRGDQGGGHGVCFDYGLNNSQTSYYLDVKTHSGFVVKLNDEKYELTKITFWGGTSDLNPVNPTFNTWAPAGHGVRTATFVTAQVGAAITKMRVEYTLTK